MQNPAKSQFFKRSKVTLFFLPEDIQIEDLTQASCQPHELDVNIVQYLKMFFFTGEQFVKGA